MHTIRAEINFPPKDSYWKRKIIFGTKPEIGKATLLLVPVWNYFNNAVLNNTVSFWNNQSILTHFLINFIRIIISRFNYYIYLVI